MEKVPAVQDQGRISKLGVSSRSVEEQQINNFGSVKLLVAVSQAGDGAILHVGDAVSFKNTEHCEFIITKIKCKPGNVIWVSGPLLEQDEIKHHVKVKGQGKDVVISRKTSCLNPAVKFFSQKAFHTTRDELTTTKLDDNQAKCIRIQQLCVALVKEINAALQSASRSRRGFILGPCNITTDLEFFHFNKPYGCAYFNYKTDTLKLLDTTLGSEWDIKELNGRDQFRFILEIKVRISLDLIITGSIKTALSNAPRPAGDCRAWIKRYELSRQEPADPADSSEDED